MDGPRELVEFYKLNPPTFQEVTDPEMVEGWLRQIKKILNAMGIVDDATRVCLATFQLRGPTEVWWSSEKETQDTFDITWSTFKNLFLDQFFPRTLRTQKRSEFMKLEQGDKSVREYEVQFIALFRHAPGAVVTDAMKQEQFRQGLTQKFKKHWWLKTMRIL